MGKVSRDPEVQVFVSLFEVGREEVVGVTRPVADLGELLVCFGRTLSWRLVDGLGEREPVTGPCLLVLCGLSGHIQGKRKLYFSREGEGNGNPLQYSCLENPMDRGAW